jgi:hypothetical protein
MTTTPPDNSEWIDDLLNSAINFKQASVDFASSAELFSDNKTVLDTANVRLDQLKTEAKAQIIAKLREARIEELERKMTLQIEFMSSADFKAGFNEALDQIDAANSIRIKELQSNSPQGEEAGTV